MPLPYRVVWIAGVPRSGSMWAFNVARALLSQGGERVLPERVPQADEEMMAEARRAWAEEPFKAMRVLKVHAALRADLPQSRFIIPHRDPRDVLVSYRRFMKCDFETVLEALPGWLRVTDHYLAFPEELALHIREPDVVAEPAAVVRRMAAFLGLDLPEEVLDKVARAHAREKVVARIAAMDRRQGKTAAPRNFDDQTGFQSGHVSRSYTDGKWREFLSKEERERVADLLGDWPQEHGYS